MPIHISVHQYSFVTSVGEEKLGTRVPSALKILLRNNVKSLQQLVPTNYSFAYLKCILMQKYTDIILKINNKKQLSLFTKLVIKNLSKMHSNQRKMSDVLVQ